MKLIGIFLLYLIINHSSCLKSDIEPSVFENAIEFIKQDIFENSDSAYDNIDDISIIVSNEIKVNDANLVICDLLTKKYQVTENCGRHIALNTNLYKHVTDSISHLQIESNEGIFYKNNLNNKFSKGYLIKFSPFSANTLLAEVGYSYNVDEGFGQGTTKIFYFIFDDDSVVKEVYTGKVSYD